MSKPRSKAEVLDLILARAEDELGRPIKRGASRAFFHLDGREYIVSIRMVRDPKEAEAQAAPKRRPQRRLAEHSGGVARH